MTCKTCKKEHRADYLCCPKCRHYNAMMPELARSRDDAYAVCRDCGFVAPTNLALALPYPTTCFGCAGTITQADHDGGFTRYADGVEYHTGCMPEPTPDGEGYYLR
jgi:hypothetical protein